MSIFSTLFGTKRGANEPTSEDIARQRESDLALLNQYLAQLIPGSEEYSRLLSEGQGWLSQFQPGQDDTGLIRSLADELIHQQQQRIGTGGAATPLEARTNLATQGLRSAAAFQPYEQDVFDALMGGDASIDSDAGRIFRDQVLRAMNPDQYYTSTFQPALDLLQQQVKARAASRGILGSGLELENLGRTGAELAIREGAAKEAFRQGQYDRFGQTFDRGQALRNRQIGLEGDLVNLQLGRESRLTDLLNQSSYGRGSDQANLAARNSDQAIADRLDEADARSARRAAIGQAVGTGAGYLMGGPLGGAVGGQLGGSLAGGSSKGSSLMDLLGETRTSTADFPTSNAPPLSSGLSRAPDQSPLDSDEFLALLKRLGATT